MLRLLVDLPSLDHLVIAARVQRGLVISIKLAQHVDDRVSQYLDQTLA